MESTEPKDTCYPVRSWGHCCFTGIITAAVADAFELPFKAQPDVKLKTY